MTAKQEGIEVVPHHGSNHRLAKGFIAGAAVGVGLGMLLAPRRGSELRKQVKVQVNNLANTAHRAKDTTGEWAHRGHDLYVVCRDKVAHAAHGTSRYVREVADAVTLKSRRSEPISPLTTSPAHVSAAGRVPVTVAPAQTDQPGRSREQASRQQEGKKDEAKKDLRAI
jgi:gas vesicle protein